MHKFFRNSFKHLAELRNAGLLDMSSSELKSGIKLMDEFFYLMQTNPMYAKFEIRSAYKHMLSLSNGQYSASKSSSAKLGSFLLKLSEQVKKNRISSLNEMLGTFEYACQQL